MSNSNPSCVAHHAQGLEASTTNMHMKPTRNVPNKDTFEPMTTGHTVTVTLQHTAKQRNPKAHMMTTPSLAHTQNEAIESATEQTCLSNTTHSSANSTKS